MLAFVSFEVAGQSSETWRTFFYFVNHIPIGFHALQLRRNVDASSFWGNAHGLFWIRTIIISKLVQESLRQKIIAYIIDSTGGRTCRLILIGMQMATLGQSRFLSVVRELDFCCWRFYGWRWRIMHGTNRWEVIHFDPFWWRMWFMSHTNKSYHSAYPLVPLNFCSIWWWQVTLRPSCDDKWGHLTFLIAQLAWRYHIS